MPPKAPRGPSKPPPQSGRKRKAPAAFDRSANNNARTKRQNLQRDARTLAVQTTSKVIKNGELDVDKFVKAREFEVRALEEGLERSKQALVKRAFQQVPKELRRRTASHNASRVPKKLKARAKREMVEDNTPTVTARKRKPTRHQRLRLETVKRLRALGAKRKQAKDKGEGVKIISAEIEKEVKGAAPKTSTAGIASRQPQVKKNKLRTPPTPKAKFRKRQLHKSWLPTHLFHAKRARMTLPKEPLWRFAIPLTPTAKSYRPTHRAASERGAIAWDTSYMATIGLEGIEQSLVSLLKALGIEAGGSANPFDRTGQKWRAGTRTWQGWLFARDRHPDKAIAPVTVIWRAEGPMTGPTSDTQRSAKPPKRALMIRVHPSAFHQLWEESVRLCKVQKPQVEAEDLRFEIGSIEMTGPASTEALNAALWPTKPTDEPGMQINNVWKALKGISDPAILPRDVLLALSIQDPRLHHPPRPVEAPSSEDQHALLQTLAEWPLDKSHGPPGIFDHKIRNASCRALPSQKAINRRKANAKPGSYPEPLPQDPRLPVLLCTSRSPFHKASSKTAQHTSWTVLLPWKAVLPVWHSIMYYPLSTGGQVRFGGLREQRQITFESGMSWFPGDYPGTAAGDAWNKQESEQRQQAWKRRPKGKRVEYSTLDLGGEPKGEIGDGWACDWQRLITGPQNDDTMEIDTNKKEDLFHMSSRLARSLLNEPSKNADQIQNAAHALVTVRLTYLTRGVPSPCARIYRLPHDTDTKTPDSTSEPSIVLNSSDQISGPDSTTPSLRDQWLSLLPSATQPRVAKAPRPLSRLPLWAKNTPAAEAQKLLAADLLSAPRTSKDEDGDKHPVVPGEEDLVGFVTTGEFSLSEGKGIGIGSLLLSRVMRTVHGADGDMETRDAKVRWERERWLCVVRNAGEKVGRLARWEIV